MPRSNMLMPQAYDLAWTMLGGILNGDLTPAQISAMPAPVAAGSTGAVGPTSSGQVMGANPRRACLILQNNSATGGPTLWFSFGEPAVASAAGSFSLPPQTSLVIANAEACPKEALYVVWSGSGTQLGAWYQNSLPKTPKPISAAGGWQTNLGAIAWGYSTPPATFPVSSSQPQSTFGT